MLPYNKRSSNRGEKFGGKKGDIEGCVSQMKRATAITGDSGEKISKRKK